MPNCLLQRHALVGIWHGGIQCCLVTGAPRQRSSWPRWGPARPGRQCPHWPRRGRRPRHRRSTLRSWPTPARPSRSGSSCSAANTMYAVGTFTAIKHSRATTSPATTCSASARPAVHHDLLDPERQRDRQLDRVQRQRLLHAYIGGKFSTVGGTAAKNLAAVSTSTGELVTGLRPQRQRPGRDAAYGNGHILAGGYFTSINSSSANPYMASLNPTTGKDDGFLHLDISGNYQFPGVCQQPDPGLQPGSSATAARWTW